MKVSVTSTYTTNVIKYDEVTDELLRWVREVPLESDAVANIPRILRRYDEKKTAKQLFKQLISKLLL